MGTEEPPEPWPFWFSRNTRHESRLFSPWMHKGRTIRNRRLDRRARRPVAAFLRVVARHGAAMARHGRHGRPEPLLPCSRLFGIVQKKILRLSQCPLSVLTGNRAGKAFTNHETRDKNHGLYAFHQTRDTAFNLHFSPRGEAKCVRGPSGRGASRLARAGVLEQYVEHGKQAQRSPGGRIVCFGRRVGEKCRLRFNGRQTFLLE